MKILAIGSHPDDIELGCWGTLEKYRAEGNEVTCFTYSKGRDDPIDQRFDTIPILTIIRSIECFLGVVNPDVVFTHSKNDLNRDHRIIHEATMVACRPSSGVMDIYCYEVPDFSMGFLPTLFVKIESPLPKRKILEDNYKEEMRDYPHPRSLQGIINLMVYRGNSIGVEYAEAFEVGRIIE